MPALHERVGQVGDHGLGAPVALGWNVEIGWRDEHDPQRIGGGVGYKFGAAHVSSPPPQILTSGVSFSSDECQL